MEEQAGQINDQEKQMRNEMLFTLSERDRGTLAMVVTTNEWKRKQVYHFLKEHLREYTFYDLDLTSQTYTSLYKALQELLPGSVLRSEPVQYLINVTGLESSLYKTEDGRIEFSSLVAQLNLERELIFNQPFIILLWVSEGFDRELQKKAPDLMHWMSKRFVFKEEGPDGMIVAEEAIEYGFVKKKGNIPERSERIAQLEETWERLCLYNEDRARLIRDKINLLRILGEEYAATFKYEKAEDAFQKALMLNNRVKVVPGVELYFDIGSFYYRFDRYNQALQNFQKALEVSKEQDKEYLGPIYHMIGMAYHDLRRLDDAMKYYVMALERAKMEDDESAIGRVYHQMGMVKGAQRRWGEALRYFQQALDSFEKAGEEDEYGGTYHEIGRAFEEQQKWEEALKNYKVALDWKKKNGKDYDMARTYHQIGLVYEGQRKWEEALESYRAALDWKKKTGNEYALGHTYHQIGRVYEQQRKWEEAITNYTESLEWNKKTGNEYAYGSTYYQLGSVFKKQRKWEEALRYFEQASKWYQKTNNEYELFDVYHQIAQVYEEMENYSMALVFFERAVDNALAYDHPDLSIVRAELERIRQKLANTQSSNPGATP